MELTKGFKMKGMELAEYTKEILTKLQGDGFHVKKDKEGFIVIYWKNPAEKRQKAVIKALITSLEHTIVLLNSWEQEEIVKALAQEVWIDNGYFNDLEKMVPERTIKEINKQ